MMEAGRGRAHACCLVLVFSPPLFIIKGREESLQRGERKEQSD